MASWVPKQTGSNLVHFLQGTKDYTKDFYTFSSSDRGAHGPNSTTQHIMTSWVLNQKGSSLLHILQGTKDYTYDSYTLSGSDRGAEEPNYTKQGIPVVWCIVEELTNWRTSLGWMPTKPQGWTVELSMWRFGQLQGMTQPTPQLSKIPLMNKCHKSQIWLVMNYI